MSIQCYFCLKLAGIRADEPKLQKAKAFIRSQGGLSQANVFTKIWLAVFGQYDYQSIPSAPPEIIFFPKNFVFSIYDFASWSRETIMALTILLSQKPVCLIPEDAKLDELYVEPPERRKFPVGKADNPFSWRGFFLLADRFFKLWERLPIKPGRRGALREVEAWIVEHQEPDGSWGGILLPWIYSLFALRSLGYPLDHPVIARGIEGFEPFLIEDENSILFQPATSPVWDTAWSLLALRESGQPENSPALVQAAQWLLDKEIRFSGDWRVKNPQLEPGCWSFEFHNDWYPDLDDSCLVPRVLMRTKLPDGKDVQRSEAIQRAVDWLLGMQSKDGGWGAFDRDNNLTALKYVPFADFLSPLDPTCADVTAHVLEFLAEANQGEAARRRGVEYLKRTQEADGAWYGRWGVNYIYGTGLALTSLRSAGEELRPTLHPPWGRMAASLPELGWGLGGKLYDLSKPQIARSG